MRTAVCSWERGESPMVAALTFPPPQPGRRSRSSGRALQRTRSGIPLNQSTSSSTKSSSPSSAQWRSSSTSTSGRFSAERLEEAPPGGERFSAPVAAEAGVRLQAHERAEVRLDPARIAGVLDSVLDGEVQLLGRFRFAVALGDACLRLDDLRERPEGDPVSVGETAALAPGDQLGIGVDDPGELVDEAALPHPRDADKGEELWEPLLAGALERVPQNRELALAPHELGTCVHARRPRRSASGPRSPPTPRSVRLCPWPRPQRPRGSRPPGGSPGRSPRRPGSH